MSHTDLYALRDRLHDMRYENAVAESDGGTSTLPYSEAALNAVKVELRRAKEALRAEELNRGIVERSEDIKER